jgi:ClpA/ClpB-like protein
MEFPPLAQEAKETLARAAEMARTRGQEQLEGPDILYVLVDAPEAVRVLELFDHQPEAIRSGIDFMMPALGFQTDADAAQRTIDLARAEAGRLGHDATGADHLLLSLVREQGSMAGGLLWSFGLTLDSSREAVRYTHCDVANWEPPAVPEALSRMTAWAPMSAALPEEVPEWVKERAAEDLDAAMSSLQAGLDKLDRVLGIGQVVEASGVVVELIALELREHAAVLTWRARTSDDRVLGSPQIQISDDVGTTYSVFPMGWSGSERQSSGDTFVTPRPPDAARTMVIEVRSFEDVNWMATAWSEPPATRGVVGPWRFEVALRTEP